MQQLMHCKDAKSAQASMPYLQEESDVTSPKDSHEATLHTSTWSSIEADLADIVPVLSSNSVPEALQTAFQAADPDFAAPIARALQVQCRCQLRKHDHHTCQSILFTILSCLSSLSAMRRQVTVGARCHSSASLSLVCKVQFLGLHFCLHSFNSKVATTGRCSD